MKKTCCLLVCLHIYFMILYDSTFSLVDAIFKEYIVHHQNERTDPRIYLFWSLFWPEEEEVKAN